MRRKGFFICMLLCVVLLLSTGLEAKKKGRWLFTAGLSYVSGFAEVVDYFERSTSFRPSYIPVGSIIVPHYQSESGFGFGLGIGPLMVIYGDVNFVNIPISLDLKYLFSPKANNSLYVRAGPKYNIAFGDEVLNSKIGGFAGVGYQFGRYALEVSYDISTITLGYENSYFYSKEEIKPSALMISFFMLF